jgi:hypothetical protein
MLQFINFYCHFNAKHNKSLQVINKFSKDNLYIERLNNRKYSNTYAVYFNMG